MKIYKSEIRRALQTWRIGQERACKTNMCEYTSPNLDSYFVRKICFYLGVPSTVEYTRAIRPHIKKMKEEGVI